MLTMGSYDGAEICQACRKVRPQKRETVAGRRPSLT